MVQFSVQLPASDSPAYIKSKVLLNWAANTNAGILAHEEMFRWARIKTAEPFPVLVQPINSAQPQITITSDAAALTQNGGGHTDLCELAASCAGAVSGTMAAALSSHKRGISC